MSVSEDAAWGMESVPGREQGLGCGGVAWGEVTSTRGYCWKRGFSRGYDWHNLFLNFFANCEITFPPPRVLRNQVRNHQIHIGSGAASGLHNFPTSWGQGGTFWLRSCSSLSLAKYVLHRWNFAQGSKHWLFTNSHSETQASCSMKEPYEERFQKSLLVLVVSSQ